MDSVTEKQKKATLTAKQRKWRNRAVRAGIQIFFFFAAPAIFTTSFSGVRYIFTQFGIHETLEFNIFLKTLIVMLIFTIVFGRFICGYACSFGSVQDGLYGLTSVIMKKAGKRRKAKTSAASAYLQYIKYVLLVVIVVLCFIGVYSNLQTISPWNAFSQITSRQFRFAGLLISTLLMLAILVASCFVRRFFCRFFCPMGAVFAWMPVLPPGRLKKDKENCIQTCSACSRNCPAGLDLAADAYRQGECISCNACQDICPKQNIHTGLGKKIKGNEIIYVIIKAAALYVLYLVSTYAAAP